MRYKKLGRSATIGLIAGVLYGSWAIYANRSHDGAHVARAASTQFVLSFCSTAFLTLLIELVLARGRSLANLVLAATGPHAGMIALFIAVHWLLGTPNVLRTIAPSASIGLVFCIVYVAKRSQSLLDEPAAWPRRLADMPGHEVAPAPPTTADISDVTV